jgi:flagellar biosynthesis/type III secretory pathway chaperone
MDAATCRAELARLLADETRLLTELEQQLEREHDFLASNDVDSLDRAGNARQATIAQLLKIEDERGSLCRMLGQPADRNGLAALFGWCDPQGTLAGAQAECTRLAGNCRARNERNGALVTARLSRVTGMLDMIAANTSARTYEPGASRTAAAPAGRLVSVSA